VVCTVLPSGRNNLSNYISTDLKRDDDQDASSINEAEYQKHMAGMSSEGFMLDPSGYERLS